MLLHPDIQKKAQDEVDGLLGTDASAASRLPTMADEERLPFVECVIKETHRINPPVPLVPHCVMADDVYRDMHIPSGAWVVANNWSL